MWQYLGRGVMVRGGSSRSAQYLIYSYGGYKIRKGVRSGVFVVDITLTTTGFSGTEDTDWVNIKQVQREE